jgi:hypothetical protein
MAAIGSGEIRGKEKKNSNVKIFIMNIFFQHLLSTPVIMNNSGSSSHLLKTSGLLRLQ